MTSLDKPTADIAKGDLDALVSDGVPEGRGIEYKLELPARGADETREFLADVSSFANAAGGDLIFGVAEVEGKPESIPGIADINTDREIQRLESLLRDNIGPRIRGVQIRAIEGFSKGPAILIHIPRSWAGPHMIKGSPRFYSRNSNGKAPLDVTEIRAAFLHSQAAADRIREFRDSRIGRILAGETPIPLTSADLVVLHCIPMSIWASGEQVEIADFINHTRYVPTIASGGRGRPNLDGYLTFSQGRDDRSASGYAQLFRNGAIETVTALGVKQVDDEAPFIASEWLEKRIIHGLEDIVSLFFQMNLEGELVAFLSLLGIRDCYMHAGPGQREAILSEQDNMLFPELLIADTSVSVSSVARPLIDHVWQAFGVAASPNYLTSGIWRYENHPR